MTSKHFSEKELSCRCGCGLLPPQDFVDCLDALRIAQGEPIIVSRCATCQKHNAEIEGAEHSYHLPETLAVDIKLGTPEYNARLVQNAWDLGFTAVEVCSKHIHIDMRPGAKILFPGVSK